MTSTTRVSHLPEQGIVAAVCGGQSTLEVVLQTISETAQASIRHRTNLLRVDLRNAPIEASITDIYHLPSLFAQAGLTRRHRLAFVAAPFDEGCGFLVTVSRNRGYCVQAFADVESAASWLMIAPTPRAPAADGPALDSDGEKR